VIAFGLGTLALGIAAFFAWSKWTRRWPFGTAGFDGGDAHSAPAPGR
jgi:hypothetical protein